MHILSFNARSATLEFGVFDTASATPPIDAIGHRVSHKECLAAARGGPRRAPLIAVDADPVAAVTRTQHVHSKS